MTEQTQTQQQEIVAMAGREYRLKRYIMFALIVALGGWFGYDGFVRYPEANRQAVAAGHKPPHTETDVRLQRTLGLILPPLGVVLLGMWLYKSRGQVRLVGQTLEAPGHPPVSFGQIQKVDRKLWDRKGIAYIHYQMEGGAEQRLKLDDFVYQAEPIRAIYKQVEEYVVGPAAGQAKEQEDTAAQA